MANDEKTYKDTLNLPQTDFDMRAKLLEKEPVIQARWREGKLYERICGTSSGRERFVLHDGPPYANGNIHMGQALNKVLKDMILRIKTMSGFDTTPFVPGWDCHGQPIEQKIVEQLGKKMETMTPMDIRRRCSAYAEGFTRVQSEQFQRLGVMGQFDKPYITMHPSYESSVLEVFARLVEQGLVYKQLKPVHWSIANRTALADAELEYHDREDTSIYVLLPIAGDSADALPGGGEGRQTHLMIWTTTPWTLPANLAVAVHPDFTYSIVRAETADGPVTFIVAEGRLESALDAVRRKREGWLRSHEVAGTLKGRQLVEAGLTYAHPLIEGKFCPVVSAEYVTLDDGTGLVHTAPGHGLDDYGTGLKCDLEIYCPVRDDGTFDETAPDWLRGVSVWDANAVIVERLRDSKTLVLDETITHSYPHDWRSRTPTIFRATEQWFIAVDRPLADGDLSLRDLAMEVCRRDVADGGVEFVPAWGRNRIVGMLESRPDWCISRQRAWGLPIPAFYNATGRPLLTPASVRAVARCFAKKGSDAWFTCTPAELLAGYDPADDEHLDNADEFSLDALTTGGDTFDVWFESGSSWFAVALGRNLVEDIPVDLYLEGSDQHRGWFQLSLLPALGAKGKAPFRTVLTHGFVVTDEGLKMSKSLGNTIDVIAQLGKRGADIIRLWVASQNYQDDIRCSEDLIAQADDAYRKVRNTLRFCMGVCFDFDPARDATDPTDHSIDLWMKLQLHRLIRDVRRAYDAYEFHKAARLLREFCTVQASNIYCSAVKDRLYCESPNAVRRRATQTVVHETLVALVKLLAPILPHTCEEAWGHIPSRDPSEPDSVHLALLPDYDEDVLRLADDLRPVSPDAATPSADELQAGPALVWDRVLALRQEGLAKLEALRNAGVKNPLDTEAVFTVAEDDEENAEFIKKYLRELEDLLGVGYARIEKGGTGLQPVADKAGSTGLQPVANKAGGTGLQPVANPGITVTVEDTRDKYARCARSWKRRPDVGSNPDYPDLSARDAAVMEEIA